MVKTMEKENKKLYKCEKCELVYKDKIWAEKCEDWCREYHTCNIEIIAHAENKEND